MIIEFEPGTGRSGSLVVRHKELQKRISIPLGAVEVEKLKDLWDDMDGSDEQGHLALTAELESRAEADARQEQERAEAEAAKAPAPSSEPNPKPTGAPPPETASPPPGSMDQDLTAVRHIGEGRAARLRELGVRTYADLAAMDVTHLASQLGITQEVAQEMHDSAQELADQHS